MFAPLSVDSCGLCGPRLGALLRVVFKAWLPLILKVHHSEIFLLGTFDVLSSEGARNLA